MGQKSGRMKQKIEISLLSNSIFYFIERVYIQKIPLDDEGKRFNFRLIVIHQATVLTDQLYETCRGAKIAFAKFYQHKTWEKGVKPDWSYFYDPADTFFEKKTPDVYTMTQLSASTA
ncbi:MAG: hypothetical protein GY940_07160 [bacterium]|nr:hypothetical protein [bacterium]